MKNIRLFKFLLIIFAFFMFFFGCEEPQSHTHKCTPTHELPNIPHKKEPSLPFLAPGVAVECLDLEAYNVFMSKNPSPPTHFFIKGRLAALGNFETLLAFVSPEDTEDYENVAITGYVYKLTDTAHNATFCFGITPCGEEALPTGTLPTTELSSVAASALVSQDDVRLITNERGAACVLDLDGIRYTYGEDGKLDKIEWAYRGLLVSFSDFDGIPSDTLSTSTVSLLLRTPTLTREMADQLNKTLIATLFPTT